MSSITEVEIAYGGWNGTSFDELRRRFTAASFQVASSLTDPICKAHEYFRRLQIVEVLYPTASKVQQCTRQVFFALGIALFSLVASFSTIPGIALRAIASALQKTPFLHERGSASEKLLDKGEFTLFSWNICCVPGGVCDERRRGFALAISN